MAGRYAEDLVGNVPEECGHLGGCDLEALTSGRIEVDCGWVVGRRAEVVGSPDYV